MKNRTILKLAAFLLLAAMLLPACAQDKGGKDSPGETTGFISEPWHIRYIGVGPATEIHASGQLLEEYLGVLN